MPRCPARVDILSQALDASADAQADHRLDGRIAYANSPSTISPSISRKRPLERIDRDSVGLSAQIAAVAPDRWRASTARSASTADRSARHAFERRFGKLRERSLECRVGIGDAAWKR